MKPAILLLLSVVLAGCNPEPRIEYVYQQVPVLTPYRPAPPPWLAEPYVPAVFPEFRPGPADSDGSGTVLLDQQGINHLKTILRSLTTRDEAWREWSKADETD